VNNERKRRRTIFIACFFIEFPPPLLHALLFVLHYIVFHYNRLEKILTKPADAFFGDLTPAMLSIRRGPENRK